MASIARIQVRKVHRMFVIFFLLISFGQECLLMKMLPKIRCSRDTRGNLECTCPEDPITDRYPDLEDTTCDSFYLCHLGRALKRQCDQNYAFHPTLRECIPRYRIPNNICTPLVNCPLRPNRFVEDKNDCTKYYLCFYGMHSHWTCPESTYFQPKEEKCLNDKLQAEACQTSAKTNFYRKIGYNYSDIPPKTSIALDASKAYLPGKNSSSTAKKS